MLLQDVAVASMPGDSSGSAEGSGGNELSRATYYSYLSDKGPVHNLI